MSLIIPLVPVAKIQAGKERKFNESLSLNIFSRILVPIARFFAVNPPLSFICLINLDAEISRDILKSFTNFILNHKQHINILKAHKNKSFSLGRTSSVAFDCSDF